LSTIDKSADNKFVKRRVAIMISGRGSNMQALINAASDENFPAQIVGVIASSPDAKGLEFARQNHIPTAINVLKDFQNKSLADQAVSKILQEWQTEIICLAGFMRILGSKFTRQWHKKTINIHPSLLPKYKGLNTHRRAIEAGDKIHGCTVHFVIDELDAGAIIEQIEVPVLPDDSEESLTERVLNQEHILYPRALEKVALKKIAGTKADIN